ncbi:MAG: PD40 domain-containing protein [Anaerolineae bacterium]|nr:PD40 domain-containing protein [Anaerolineae bacterium]
MSIRKILYIFCTLALITTLAACTPDAAPVENTASPSSIPAVTDTATVEVTVTPDATSTPLPTDTPVPTPTDTPLPVITLPYTPQVPEGAVARIGMGNVEAAVPSPDGQYLAVSTPIGTFLYNMATFEELWSTGQRASFLAFSPDSRLLAGRRAELFALWEAETGELLQTFEANNYHNFNQSAFSPDSSRLAYGSGNSVVVRNIQSGAIETSLVGHSDEVTAAVFVTDDLLASGSKDAKVILWNLATGEVVKVLEGHESTVYTLAVSPDGQILVTSSKKTQDSVAQTILWDVLTGEKLTTIDAHYIAPVFSPDGTLLAARNEKDYIVDIRDASSGQLLRRLDTFDSAASVAFSPDGYLFVASRETDAIYKVNPTTGQIVVILDGFTSSVDRAVFSSDGSQLLTANSELGEPSITLRDLESGQIVLKLAGFAEEGLIDAAISPDGSLIAAASYSDDCVYLWDTSTGELINTFSGYYAEVEFSPDGRWLAYRSARSAVTLRDVVTWQPILEIKEADGDLEFSPDGNTLAAVYINSVILYGLPEGAVLQAFECSERVTSIAYSPDGVYLATSPDPLLDDNAVIVLWNIASGQPTYELHGHKRYIHDLAFSSDGNLLASGSFDGTAILWNVETGQTVKTLSEDGGYTVTSVDFSPDGSLLATGSGDGTVIIWPVE